MSLTMVRSLLSVVFVVAFASSVRADDVTLHWDANPETDNVIGYRVFVGTIPGVYTESFDVGNVTTYTVGNRQPDVMYYFAVAAYDARAEGPKAVVGWPLDGSLAHVPVKAAHITQLRAGINQLRIAGGLPAYPWTDATLVPGVTLVRVTHLVEMRSALAELYAWRHQPLTFNEGIVPGATPIRASHISELRQALFDIQ